jgi:hypothetical protein
MRSFLNREDGSLPLAMMSVLIVTALTAVATSTMVLGQAQVRRDQAFEQALQVADTGLNRMITLVETRDREATFCMGTPPTTLPGYLPVCTVSNTVTAPSTYSGQAIRDETLDAWTLTVRATVNGRSRTIQSVVPMGSPFTDAAVGRQKIELQGGNRADSFRSGTFSNGSPRTFAHRPYADYLNTDNSIKDPTKKGFFVTEGPLNLNGQSFQQSDGAKIWYAKNPGYLGTNYVSTPLPGATGICEGVTETCQGYNVPRDAALPFGDGNRRLEYYRDRVKMPPLRVPTQPFQHFDGTNKTLVPISQADPVHGKLAGQPYVFRSAKLYSTTTFTGTAVDPVVIYVTGEFTAPSHQLINFETDPLAPTLKRPRPSPSLLMYSTMVGNAVQLSTGVQISGGVYAPYGNFIGGSQGEIFGALTADIIRTNGGWKFHYDETMSEIRGSDLKAIDWVEVGG